MDKLVAQYSRLPHQNEFYSEQEQQDLTETVPPLSLKFSLPPVENVSVTEAKIIMNKMAFGYCRLHDLTSIQVTPQLPQENPTSLLMTECTTNLYSLGTVLRLPACHDR